MERPVLFQLSIAAVMVALIRHLFAVYRRSTAALVIVSVSWLALTKEFGTLHDSTPDYEVLIQSIVPGPIVIACGWVIVFLLGLEASRLAAERFPRARLDRYFARVFVVALYGALASIPVEMIGQTLGWWRWRVPSEIFPRPSWDDWFGVELSFALIVLLIAGATRRFLWQFPLIFLVGTILSGLIFKNINAWRTIGIHPAFIAFPVFLAAPFLVPGLVLHERLRVASPASRWKLAPIVSELVIVGVLCLYLLLRSQPEALVYAVPYLAWIAVHRLLLGRPVSAPATVAPMPAIAAEQGVR